MKYFIHKILYAITYVWAYSPRRVQFFLAHALSVLWFDVFRIRRDIILNNIRMAFPEYTKKQAITMARKSMYNLCLNVIESSVLLHFKNEWFDKYFLIERVDDLKEALLQNKGVLVLSLHLGNGDMGGLGLVQLGFKVNLISKHFNSKWLDEFWFGLRNKVGIKFISHEKSSFDILRSLNRKEIVIFVLDQFMGPPVGVKTNFFGRSTGTAAGLAVFAQKTGAPVVPMYTYRHDDGRIVIRSEPIIPFEISKDQSDNIQVMTQIYTDKVEQIIRAHPDQWMWVHRRWKEFSEN